LLHFLLNLTEMIIFYNHDFVCNFCRLSSRLVRSEDGSSALHLWQEYLHHVQAFLSGALPSDFDGLSETQRLCEVHQNLLTSQHAVLLKRKEIPEQLTQSVQEHFNSLANLHNETLARIMERHSEVRNTAAVINMCPLGSV